MRNCFGDLDPRPLMGCDGCSDFEACRVVTGAGDGVVAVVDEGVMLNPDFDLRRVEPRLWAYRAELDGECRGAAIVTGEDD